MFVCTYVPHWLKVTFSEVSCLWRLSLPSPVLVVLQVVPVSDWSANVELDLSR